MGNHNADVVWDEIEFDIITNEQISSDYLKIWLHVFPIKYNTDNCVMCLGFFFIHCFDFLDSIYFMQISWHRAHRPPYKCRCFQQTNADQQPQAAGLK